MAKRIYGIFDDEEILIEAIKKLKAAGVSCVEAQTPFPVHGLEKLLGIPRTRISITSFMYGATGTSLALLMTWYMMIHDWPINIGGKPNFALYLNLPAFIPVTFEMTVFCAAHGMAITYFLRSKLLPGVTAPMPAKRITDDKFVLHMDVAPAKIAEAAAVAKSNGASEVII
ncbi:MAG: hypothetical protein RIQ89_1547 [Bacteroidota bacterium]|jgi:hypothetical protein